MSGFEGPGYNEGFPAGMSKSDKEANKGREIEVARSLANAKKERNRKGDIGTGDDPGMRSTLPSTALEGFVTAALLIAVVGFLWLYITSPVFRSSVDSIYRIVLLPGFLLLLVFVALRFVKRNFWRTVGGLVRLGVTYAIIGCLLLAALFIWSGAQRERPSENPAARAGKAQTAKKPAESRPAKPR